MTYIKYQHNNFASILKKYQYSLHTGDIVAGTILYKEDRGFLVNIGDKSIGYLPIEEITSEINKNSKHYLKLLNLTREFFIIAQNHKIKQYILSIKRLEYIRGWKRIKQINLEDIIFNTKIKYLNKGGIITYLEGIQGFIPKSHIFRPEYNKYKYNVKKKYIQYKLLIVNEQNNQLIMSNKSAMLHLSTHKFKLGEIVYGEVISIISYGAFININKIIGLLHISEINSKYIKRRNFTYYIGKVIKVKIIYINTKQGKLSVSTRLIQNI
uniref:Ribosomal protein S1 n=1 Tax=Cliftonaea pectinata TaxID=2007206 RepID=A0A1Z1MPM5_9FLOR|nr:ribosomal protein S1 [Cliftonaea pectinata]ARW68040.1 ribosomal protein S1 [Cliftonaea pectinata]